MLSYIHHMTSSHRGVFNLKTDENNLDNLAIILYICWIVDFHINHKIFNFLKIRIIISLKNVRHIKYITIFD